MATELRNWIADNRNSELPPSYFLQRLYDFDAELVLMPSRERPGAYVLGRRKQWGPGLTEEAIDAVYTKADTKMAIINGTVPVCMVFKPVNGSWSPDPLIRTLMARDMWAHGGADKVADMLEAQEDAERAKVDADIREDMRGCSREAWRSYQARTGQSTIQFKGMYPTKTGKSPQPGSGVRKKNSKSTVGLGQPRRKARRRATIGR